MDGQMLKNCGDFEAFYFYVKCSGHQCKVGDQCYYFCTTHVSIEAVPLLKKHGMCSNGYFSFACQP